MLKPSQDKIFRFMSEDLSLRAAVVISSHTVQEVCLQQKTDPVASIALGRVLTGALLVAAHLDDDQQVGLLFDGDGPLGPVFAEAAFNGDVRGYCTHGTVIDPAAPPELSADYYNSLSVGAAIGKGILRVVRSVPFQKAPQVANVPIHNGEVGLDIAYYLHQSFQIPSVVSVGVLLDQHGAVSAAGGVIIELLPQASDFTSRMVERISSKAASVSRRIADGVQPLALLKDYVGEMTMKPSGVDHNVRFLCRCTQERVERSLVLLGVQTIDDMLKDGEALNLRCEFCGKNYVVGLARLQHLRHEASSK